jgi:hypothetical protein
MALSHSSAVVVAAIDLVHRDDERNRQSMKRRGIDGGKLPAGHILTREEAKRAVCAR